MKKILIYILYFVIGLFVISFLAYNAYLLLMQSIRLDEAQSIWYATKSLPTLLKITSQDVHVPLYFIVLHLWINAFGSSILQARILSLIFFVLTLPVLFLLVRKYSQKETAIITLILFCFSPFIMWYSVEARMYSLFIFITALNTYAYLSVLDSKGQNSKLLYVLSLLFGIATHYFFLFQIAMQGIYLLYTVVEMKGLTISKVLKNNIIQSFGAMWTLVFVALGSWVYFFIQNGLGTNTTPFISKPSGYNLLTTYFNFFLGFQSLSLQNIAVSLWPLSVLALFALFGLKSKTKTKYIGFYTLSAFLPIALSFIISFFKPIFLSRYLIFTTPLLFILMAHLVVSRTKSRGIVTSVIVSIFMAVSLINQTISNKTPVKENYTEISQYLSQNAKAQDIVVTTPPFTSYPIEYSYSGIARISSIPEWNRYEEGAIPVFNNEDLNTQIRDYQKIYNSIYIVFSYDQGYEDDIITFMDNNFELLNSIEFSPNLHVRHYKLRYDREWTNSQSQLGS